MREIPASALRPQGGVGSHDYQSCCSAAAAATAAATTAATSAAATAAARSFIVVVGSSLGHLWVTSGSPLGQRMSKMQATDVPVGVVFLAPRPAVDASHVGVALVRSST